MKRSSQKRKALVIGLFIGLMGIGPLIIGGGSLAQGADWKYLLHSKETNMTHYYDRESITFPSSHSFRVWVKNVDPSGDYKKCHVELNCKEKRFTFLTIISYTQDDRIQYGSTYPVQWEAFRPGSFLNFLSAVVCSSIPEDGAAKQDR
jgi:hypothetical protein